MTTPNLVPPDGGYGWVVMGAVALSNIIVIPIAQGFGLIFKDRFKELGFSAANTALIMNSSAAISMFCGIFNGPLLNNLGYRKVALISATLTTIGVLLTAQANSFMQYILTYGLITGYGMGMSMSAYFLALNSYFRKKRAKAVGYALAICGIGPIIMPQIFSFLIWKYGVTGAVTVVAGIATHTYISALLLQPVKWHMKKEVVEEDEDNKELLEEENKDEKENTNIQSNFNKKLAASTLSLEEQLEIEAIYGIDPSLGGSVLSLYSNEFPQRTMSISSRRRSPLKEFDENDEISMQQMQNTNEKDKKEEEEEQKDSEKVKEKPSNIFKRIGKFLVDTFDLTLLKDPIYVNIMIGMSFAVFAEMNFSLLTPFIMQDFGLETQQIATFMSTVSIVDVCFRFIAPYVSDFFKQPSRIMYLWSLLLLILSRSSLLLTNDFYGLLGCAVFLGVAKGFRTVYWSLVIPDYVPIERLAAASGMQSTFNSLFMWVGGSFLGVVMDVFGSYRYCIFLINCMTFVTIAMWTTEIIYKRKFRRRSLNSIDRDTENVK